MMHLTAITPTESLEKAYRLQAGNREQIDRFKAGFVRLFSRINEKESEENVKGHLMDFLKEVYYNGTALGEAYIVAPKGKTDFVIHNGKDATTPAGVLFEVKRPANKGEMITRQNLNTKAFHELLLYYFRERLEAHNNDIRYCVITNVYEWFIFDAADIDRLFFRNAHLIKEYKDWVGGRKVSKNNELFYNEIIKPFLVGFDEEIRFAYFDLRTFETVVTDSDAANDKALLPLYKVLSPTHLLKLPTATDSNRLNPKFYAELLHLIGLEEVKEGGKKVIQRKEKDKRDEGSLLENTILELDSSGKFNRLTDRGQYGTTTSEQIFNVALELCITWVNRVLFLKLLESQLVTYHNDNRAYAFLNHSTIPDFDELNKLFFRVLAKKSSDRQASIQAKFGRVPYLNSSLFELTELENDTVSINQLDNGLHLPLLRHSVLNENSTYRNVKDLPALAYLFAFLEAYDFTSESREVLQEKNRTLINASVLGLIFEKINGYKDGSFYTPGFITEYMCRETIRKAVVQKFNEAKGWNCADFAALEDKDLDRAEANALINEIRICDPAVGSGHFLVSALNELITVKSDLGVLQDAAGKRIKDYTVSILNDELIIQDEDETPFQYVLGATGKPTPERQRVQKTLFHEKQTIIENCLFGVDINPNSVKICRLRLWIELLKNAYYTDESGFSELETLPNIDINIKQGNSLLSKFSLTEDLSDVFRKQGFTLRSYKDAVAAYKEAKTKEAKADLQHFINEIKEQFRQTVYLKDPRRKSLLNLLTKRAVLDVDTDMFGNLIRGGKAVNDPQIIEKERINLDRQITDLETEIADIEANALYRNSFEWRFEFPEVLNDKGDFFGFDAIIGNPPYGINIDKQLINIYRSSFPVSKFKPNLYTMFIEKFYLSTVAKSNAIVSFIVPKSLLRNSFFSDLRKNLLENTNIVELVTIDSKVFEEAEVGGSLIFTATLKNLDKKNTIKITRASQFDSEYKISLTDNMLQTYFLNTRNYEVSGVNEANLSIISKLNQFNCVRDYFTLRNGLNPGNVKNILITKSKLSAKHKPIIWGRNIAKYNITWSGDFINYDNDLRETINILDVQSKLGMSKQSKIDFALRSPELFESKKIVIRKTGDSMIAAIDEKHFYFDTLVHGIYSRTEFDGDYPLESLLAILNSKIATWIYRTIHDVKGQAFAKISLDKLSEFPIPNIDSGNVKKLKVYTDSIISAKVATPTSDTSALEAEIDCIVYGLYGLTDEEIAIIEG